MQNNTTFSFENFTLICGDALTVMKDLADNSVHLIVTDPPYFLDGMGKEWNKTKLEKKTSKAKVVGAMPVGMKFSVQDGERFQSFMYDIAKEAIRVLKPGGFMISFSQARLYGRLAIALEEAGFEMRDMMVWNREGQAKAFGQTHFLEKRLAKGLINQYQFDVTIQSIGGRKTAQLKPQIEPMTLAQKPREGTLVDNWLSYETGLMDATQSLDGKFPGNLMTVPRPNRAEKGKENDHLTVKPVALIEHIIRLFSKEGQIVLDPFVGSGSHGVAALLAHRMFIGIDLEPAYIDIALQRMLQVS